MARRKAKGDGSGPGSGIQAINGNTNANQTIVGGAGINVSSAGGVTTVTNTSPNTPTTSTNPHTPITANVLDFIDAYKRTWAQLNTLKTAGTLVEGFYHITNPAQAMGVILRAEYGDQLSTDAMALFALGDYQNVGDYSALPNQSAIGSSLGAWNAGLTPAAGDLVSSGIDFKWYVNLTGVNTATDPSADPTNWAFVQTGEWDSGGTYVPNQVVIYIFGSSGIGQMYVNTTGVNGGAPNATPADWTPLTPGLPGNLAGNPGYIFEWDRVTYDFTQDAITARWDKLGNEYVGLDWYLFQWGNANVLGNSVRNGSTVNCLHNKGSISACTFADGLDLTLELNTLVSWSGCEISNYFTSIVADATLSFSGKILNGAISTFNIDLVASTNYAGGVLTIPANLHWYGVINLTDAAGGFISNIVNGSQDFPFKLTCANLISNTISPIAIAGAVAGDIVSDGGNVILTGRTNGSDFYELIASGNVYMKNNVTALL